MFLSQLGRADDNASGVGAEWEVLGTAGQNMSYKNAKRSKAAHKLRATHPGPPPATPPNALMDDGDIDESRRYERWLKPNTHTYPAEPRTSWKEFPPLRLTNEATHPRKEPRYVTSPHRM